MEGETDEVQDGHLLFVISFDGKVRMKDQVKGWTEALTYQWILIINIISSLHCHEPLEIDCCSLNSQSVSIFNFPSLVESLLKVIKDLDLESDLAFGMR